jgi:Bacterial membrane protein YfhO
MRSDRLSRAVAASTAPLLLLLITIAFFWKLTLTDQYTCLNSPDMANQVLPWLDFQAREFHKGRIPLWDPHLWAGQSLIAQQQPGTAYPPNWLLFLLPLKDGHIRIGYFHWYWVLIHFFAALFCHWLCRDLKRSRTASVLAGAAFGLGGYIGYTDWPQHLNSAIWAPLVLLFFLRAMRGERPAANAALSGAFLGVCFLGGHFQIPIFLALSMAGLWLLFLRRIGLAALFWTLCFLTSAAQTLPALEYGRSAVRWAGAADALRWNQVVPYTVHAEYSFQPSALLGIVVPGIQTPSSPFTGVAVLTLALLAGLACARRGRETGVFAAIAVAGLALALGSNSFLHGLAYSLVPMVEKARNPSMAILIFHFGVCVLAAYGFDHFRASAASRAARWALIVFSAFIGLLLLAGAILNFKFSPDVRPGIPMLAAFGLIAVLWLWEGGRISRLAAGMALLALMLFEMSNVSTFYLPPREGPPYLARIRDQADIAQFLKKQPGLPRVDFDEEDVPYNFGDWHGIDQFGGYVASMPERTLRVQGDTKMRQLLGVEFRVSRKAPPAGFTQEVFASSSGLKVYRNPDALPRVRVVHRAADAALAGPPPQLEDCGGDVIHSFGRTPNTFTVDVEMKCRGLLLVADPVAPGWQARVNGRPAEMREAYGFIRALVLSAGRHHVSMRYRPASVVWGAALTLAGLALATALGIYPFKSWKASSISRFASADGGQSGSRGTPP